MILYLTVFKDLVTWVIKKIMFNIDISQYICYPYYLLYPFGALGSVLYPFGAMGLLPYPSEAIGSQRA